MAEPTPPPAGAQQVAQQVINNSLLRECPQCQLVNEVCNHQFKWLEEAIAAALTTYATQRAGEAKLVRDAAENLLSYCPIKENGGDEVGLYNLTVHAVRAAIKRFDTALQEPS